MNQRWVRVSLAVVLASGVLVAACAEKHEDGDDDSHGLPTAPSSSATTTTTPTTPAPTPTPAPAPAPTPAPAATVAFTQDVKPILSGCVRCHSNFTTYSGTMRFVTAGNANSLLVTKTQAGGSMYTYLSGDRAAAAALIRQWVLAGAPENR